MDDGDTNLFSTRAYLCYNSIMTPKLSDEQRQALDERGDSPVPVQDEQSQRVYFLVDQSLHERAMGALQQREDLAAITEGIADMEAGRVVPFEEVDARIRKKLGLPARQ